MDNNIAGACGEHDLDDHVAEFGNLQLVASAVSGYVLHLFNLRNSLIDHPPMHAPSLARVIDGKSGMVSGEGVGTRLIGTDTCAVGCFVAR